MGRAAGPVIEVRNLRLNYGDTDVLRDLNFTVKKGDIFIVMGVSGCGKSTLLKAMVGLKEPHQGEILYGGINFWDMDDTERQNTLRRFGVLYQSGALWSSLTLEENVSLPLELYSKLPPGEIKKAAALKLSLVGLEKHADLYPSELSGGMHKRASLARALALDPDIIFFDEPSAGLDPINARMLDDLILRFRDELGTTFVVVTHELASIFTVGNNAIFLDEQTKTMTASGDPKTILKESTDPRVIEFLTRGKKRGGEH